ncbi:hypothetical protein D3C80_1403090 [compost metagenome]
MSAGTAQYKVSPHALFVSSCQKRTHLALKFRHMDYQHVVTCVTDPGCCFYEASYVESGILLRTNSMELAVLGKRNTAEPGDLS